MLPKVENIYFKVNSSRSKIKQKSHEKECFSNRFSRWKMEINMEIFLTKTYLPYLLILYSLRKVGFHFYLIQILTIAIKILWAETYIYNIFKLWEELKWRLLGISWMAKKLQLTDMRNNFTCIGEVCKSSFYKLL